MALPSTPPVHVLRTMYVCTMPSGGAATAVALGSRCHVSVPSMMPVDRCRDRSSSPVTLAGCALLSTHAFSLSTMARASCPGQRRDRQTCCALRRQSPIYRLVLPFLHLPSVPLVRFPLPRERFFLVKNLLLPWSTSSLKRDHRQLTAHCLIRRHPFR